MIYRYWGVWGNNGFLILWVLYVNDLISGWVIWVCCEGYEESYGYGYG